MVLDLFWLIWRIIGATLLLKWNNLENMEHFFESLKTDSNLFKMVQIYLSMSLRNFRYVIKLIWHNLENTEIPRNIPRKFF